MQNEMAYLEFIHNLVETMDKYFENVCELDIMYNIEKAHYILDEMIMNGQIVETNKTLILAPLYVLDKLQEWYWSFESYLYSSKMFESICGVKIRFESKIIQV